MSNIIKDESLLDKVVKAYCAIIDRCEFPKFGSPEMKCDKCMFNEVTCHPYSDCVGCFLGWKMESEE